MRRYVYKRQNLSKKKKLKKAFGISFIFIGLTSLLYFFFPIISYYVYLSTSISSMDIESPLPKITDVGQTETVSGLLSSGILGVTTDKNDARNLLPNRKSANSNAVIEYSLSIPSQKIYNAKVSATDYDLSKHLVQYFSTSSNPIDKGTTIIFGHSSLPYWFDPADYTKIFSKIHLLKIGQKFTLHVDNKDYKYQVVSKTIISSKDPRLFYQNFDNSYVSLVTCTPPGTTWKRLVVRGVLQKSDEMSLKVN